MPATSRVIFQTYVWKKTGRRSILKPRVVVACRSAEDALRRIEKVKDGLHSSPGAQAVHMSVDEDGGNYGEPAVLGAGRRRS